MAKTILNFIYLIKIASILDLKLTFAYTKLNKLKCLIIYCKIKFLFVGN